MSDTQRRSEAEPVQGDKAVEGAEGGPAPGRVVETDVMVTLFGIEHDGKLALTDTEIRDAVSGMALYLRGHKFVLCVEPEGKPERFFFPEELSGEAVAVSAYVDGRTLMTLVACAGVALTQVPALLTSDFNELRAAVACVKSAMEGVSVEVRGGG